MEETSLQHLTLHPRHNKHHNIPIAMYTHPIPVNLKRQEDRHYHHEMKYVFMLDDKESNNEIHIQENEVGSFQRLPLNGIENIYVYHKLKKALLKVKQTLNL